MTKEEHTRNDVLREDLFMRRHESGVPVYLCPKPGFQKRYACFATHFGSIDASFSTHSGDRHDVPDGVAHFLEHKLFEGKQGNAFEEFSRLGAAGNAYTSFGVTNYLFSCHSSFFENLAHLIRFVQEPYFTDENVEKEKGIIGQEIQMYEDNPYWRSFFNLLECLYSAHPIRKNIAGSIESISDIDKEVLYQCYNTFYHPENMILFAIGDIDQEMFFDHADRTLCERDFDPLGEIERFYPEEAAATAEAGCSVSMEVSMPRLMMGFKDRDVGYGGRRYLRKELVTVILLEIIFGRGSELFQRLYSSRLIDDGFGASYTGVKDAGHSLIGGETPDPERLVQEVLDGVDRVRQNGIAEDDFERQKRSVMGGFFRSFNSLEFTANNFCSYQFSGTDLFDVIEVLHGMELAHLEERLAQHLVRDAMAYSIVLPKNSEQP